jgi:hypothetical protein
VGGGFTSTDGSSFISTPFAANAGADLSYYFNYVTSDGFSNTQGGLYADYAWAQLRLADGITPVATLLTARTDNTGNTVPGFSMPAMDATVTPPTVTAAGGTNFSPLGPNIPGQGGSGGCFGPGCGHTGWILSEYEIQNAGFYTLVFGVSNYRDQFYDSAFAFTGIFVDGDPIDPVNQVPIPSALPLFASGLAGFAWLARRRKKAQQIV